MALFLEHVNVVLNKLRQDPITALSTDTTTEAYRAQIAVNRAIARVWNYKQWAFKRRTTTIATVSGTMAYVLPKSVGEIYQVLSSGNVRNVKGISKVLFDEKVNDPSASGDPEVYFLGDNVGAQVQPTAASTISVSSSSAADITQLVAIVGLVSGEEDYEEVTLTGTTPVVTTKSFTSILSVTKSATTAGRVTLTSNSGAVTNLILGGNEKTTRIMAINFYNIPSSILTMTINHYRIPPILSRAYEDTQIPSRWDYVIDQWGFALALQGKGQDQLSEFTAQAALGDSMLSQDMASEEVISNDQPIILGRAGEGGIDTWQRLPTGYGVTESF